MGREGEAGKVNAEGLGGIFLGTDGKASKTLLSNIRGPEVEDDVDAPDIHDLGRAEAKLGLSDGD
jgi:hypothetical protein